MAVANDDARPDVTVVGAGAMGGLFGVILHDGGLHVTLVGRSAENVAAIRAHGLAIEGFAGDRTVTIPATTQASDIDATDLIIVLCKSHSTRAAARSVRHLVDGGAVVVSFQNGLGNEQVIAEELGTGNVLGGVTTMAAVKLAPGRIRDFARAPSTIGEMAGGVSERTVTFSRALTAAGLETHASDDVVRDIWNKLLGNISLSAVSGIANLTSAGALQIPELRATSLRAIDEALAVAAAEGIALERDAVLRGMEAISTPNGTGDNKSSLCVDLMNRRPTEVEFIYGTVIAKAHAVGIATPTLDTLRALVKGIESHYVV